MDLSLSILEKHKRIVSGRVRGYIYIYILKIPFAFEYSLDFRVTIEGMRPVRKTIVTQE